MKHKWNGNKVCGVCGLKKIKRAKNGQSAVAYTFTDGDSFKFTADKCRVLGDKEKHCPKCNTTKLKVMFDKDPSRHDGYTGLCKDCRQYAVRWNENNPEKLKGYNRKKNRSIKYINYRRDRQKFILRKAKGTYMDFYMRLRLLPHRVINLHQGGRYKTPIKYLGCSREHFLRHLESKFRDGMTWGNYASVWQVDHIYPFGLIDKRDRDALIKNSHWSNTQPLLIHENFNKGKLIFDKEEPRSKTKKQ